MGRKLDPLTPYRVFIQNDRKYQYASVTVEIKETEKQQEQKKRTTTVHLGKIENNRFVPNASFRLTPVSERIKYIFPEGIDLTLFHQMNDISYINSNNYTPDTPGESVSEDSKSVKAISPEITDNNVHADNHNHDDTHQTVNPSDTTLDQTNNRLYGAFWLLEQVGRNCGLYEDLLSTFGGNKAKVNEVISLALFPYLSNRNYNRFAKWQNTHKTLLDYQLRAPAITVLTQSISNDERLALIKKRIERQPKGSLVDCDSTTRSAWGKCLADIRWGNNKDNEKLQNTIEVVVYSMETHEPLYYRSFPGNISDMSTVRTVISDLKGLQVQTDVVFSLDRGYISDENLASFIEADIPFIMCAKVRNQPISSLLLDITYDEYGVPQNMNYDIKNRLFYCQKDIPTYDGKLADGTYVEMKGMKANLFLNIRSRMDELTALTIHIEEERALLKEAVEKKVIPPDIKKYNATFTYFKVTYLTDKNDKNKPVGIEYTECQDKIRKDKAMCGFFGSIMYKLDLNGEEALKAYKSRDEHEKSWDQMKNQMGFYVLRNSSEDGRDGRTFIMFVGLIMVSKVRHFWKKSMYDLYESTYDMSDEMEPIRFSEYTNGTSHMTTFTGRQVQICDACEVTIPPEVIPKAMREAKERKENPKKRGRKPKNKAESQ